MGVKFDNTLLTNYGKAQTVENSFKVFGNWSSIHDFSFDDELTSNTLTVPRTTTNSWSNHSIYPSDVSSDCYIEFDIDSSQDVDNGIGVICMWDEATDTGYLVGIDTSGNSFLASYNGTTATMICKRPIPFTVACGHFEVAARQQYYSTSEDDIWLTFSMWVNGALIDTWAIYKGSPINYATRIGFAHYGVASEFIFSNVRVPQLTAFVEWNSIDTGENPIGGLQRVIEGRYLKFFVRFDGSLRAWRSHATDSLRTFNDEEDVYTNAYKLDKRKLYNHVRVLGAFVEAEYISAPILNMGHRFTEVNNPYLMTVSDCYDEAKNHIRRMIEESISANITTPFSPLLENEDRVTTSLGEHIITAREWKFNGRGQIVDQQLSMRKYGFPVV